ncbi:MAG: hypothetical protein A7315_05950 [Candidatus Altiarchaeales archaeon WOR_SM1_79]|nr:MAG: hypothetical protein A7315_05950 [Candidatus Altiarchaeales archaeon WOR_SM1_79]
MKGVIPTEPIRIVVDSHFAIGTATNNLIGSCTIPKDKIGQLTVREVMFAGGVDSKARWFYMHSNKYGTLQWMQVYNQFGSVEGGPVGGKISDITDIYEPIESFPAGTVNFYANAPGSAVDVRANLRIDLV